MDEILDSEVCLRFWKRDTNQMNFEGIGAPTALDVNGDIDEILFKRLN